jgi:cytidylate kinase
VSVITVSRGSFSGGKAIAEDVAEQLGYRCIDRDAVVERAAASGAPVSELVEALEKPPAFLERFTHKRYLYLTLFQAALAEEARSGKVVYHGLAGHLLLKGALPVFRVRIIAPLDLRIQMCEARLKMTREQAVTYIRNVDQGRRRWTQYLYGVDWADPALYDLVLNLETLSVAEASDIVVATMQQQRCFEFGPNCQAAMDNLALATRVKAAIALNPSTSDLEVETAAEGAKVWVRGKLNRSEQYIEVKQVVAQVPGVSDMNLEALSERYIQV